MKFIDECSIKVEAGKGGDGIISFRREYRVDRGGPDGGDGGRGGSIFFVGDSGINTLTPLKYKKHIFGNNGQDGKRKNMYGAKGEDIFIKVPLGTLVYSQGVLLHDITKEHHYLIAKGGRGGRGNVKFKTARNTAPKISENGDPGQKLQLDLVLKVLADIGFVGKPSAGKSTLLSKLSNAKPKIADYPFTTLTPQLGIVNVDQNKSFVAADLPGLISGASQGKGLGFEFLKHIERCKVIAHVVDFGDDLKNPLADYESIRQELKKYSWGLENREQLIVANKSDLPNFTSNLQSFKKSHPNLLIVEISAQQEKNLQKLKYTLWQKLNDAKPIEIERPKKEVTIQLPQEIIIHKIAYGIFEIEGEEVAKIYNKIPLNSWENFKRFNHAMKNIGVWKELIKEGVKAGDVVRIYSYEFQWSKEELQNFS